METTVFQWQVRQPTGRWRLLAWRMSEELAGAWAAREGRALRKVPGSEEIRRVDPRPGGLMEALGTAR